MRTWRKTAAPAMCANGSRAETYAGDVRAKSIVCALKDREPKWCSHKARKPKAERIFVKGSRAGAWVEGSRVETAHVHGSRAKTTSSEASEPGSEAKGSRDEMMTPVDAINSIAIQN